MKKNYFFILVAAMLSINVNAQTILSQNFSNTIIEGTSACDTRSPDFITADNIYYRAFDLMELGYSEFSLLEITFGVEKVENPSIGFAIELIVYGNSGDDFPNGTLTEVSRVSVPLTIADTGMLKTIPITGTVNEDQMVVAISIPNEDAAGNTTSFLIGSNNLGESDPTYTFSSACGDTEPVTFESLNIFGQHLILNVGGNATLSDNDVSLTEMSIYPNPVKDFVNITLKGGEEIESARVFSMQGQSLMEIKGQNKLDLSALSTGIYILKVSTDKGEISQQIIKQ